MLVSLEEVLAARDRIEGRVHRTPTFSATTLGRLAGVNLWLKAELLQRTGSFKPRGVFNKLLSMDPGDLARGLVSISAGNHAAALAYGATSLGTKATIVMPETAVASKIDATRGYGGDVVLTGGSLMETCLGLQRELTLGSLNAVRDWSFAGDTMRGAWLMLQQETADDYVLASGVPHTVAELARTAFACVDLDAERYVRVDAALLRPPEATPSVGDASKARKRLGWEPTMRFEALVERMVRADLRSLEGVAAGS